MPGYIEVSDLEARASQDSGDQVVTCAVGAAQALEPGVEVVGDAVEGDPVQVLIEESARASGTRARVAQAQDTRIRRPRLGQRGCFGAGGLPGGGDTWSLDGGGAGVVIGVADTGTSEAVLGFGFDYASRCGRCCVTTPTGWRSSAGGPNRRSRAR